MNFLPRNRLNDIMSRYNMAEDLIRTKDTEFEPFKSKYEARNILKGLLRSFTDDVAAANVQALALGAAFYSAMGCLDMDVQELSEGESHLQKSCNLLMEIPDSHNDLGILCKVKTLNQLGILWCVRNDYERAEIYLKKSLAAYESFKGELNQVGFRKPAYGIRDLFLMSVQNPSLQPSYDSDKVIDLANAYTYYFLAQVYQKLSQPEKSAECCHTTLRKQLELKEYEALDWATNAATLSHHYIVHEMYAAAKSHLGAASFVLERYRSELDSKEFPSTEDKKAKDEAFNQCDANVSVSWGKYALHLMESSMEQAAVSDDGHPSPVASPQQKQETLKYWVEFDSIEMDPYFKDIPVGRVKDFEGARAAFLPGQRYYNRAKAFYTFHEHCTNHVEIQQDLSRMLKVLIYFESDVDRQFKMHKRRVDLLQPIYTELNPSVYTLTCRQLLFELGETFSAMACIKHQKLKSLDPNAPTLDDDRQAVAKKINALVKSSVFCFEGFLDTMTNGDGKMPERFAPDICRSSLLAYFHLGRICSKYVTFPEATNTAINWLRWSHSSYKHVVDYCAKDVEAAKLVESELLICQELVSLLPLKVRRLKLELEHPEFSSAASC